MNINLVRNTPTIGATLTLDLAGALHAGSATKRDAIEQFYTALIEHLVVFIEDLVLTPAEQIDFALRFGALDVPHPVCQTLEGCPKIVALENDGDRPPDTNDWHTDLTFRPNPPFMSILYAKQVPKTGGDTLWANLTRFTTRYPIT